MSELRDTIYGFIEPGKDEWKIMDTPLLQRLRRIRQLAMAQLVYPGALHTRFEHSLGVFFLASKMAKKLLKDEDDVRIVKFAALLHDVGHGPFSHVSESILELFAEDSTSSSLKTEKIHERITAELLKRDVRLKQILGEDKIADVIGLLSGEKVDISLMKQIVSGPIDADKQDYLLRDSYFCGVKYGVYDYERLINTLDKYEDDGDTYICFNHDGIHVLEQFILAKYYMTWQVYRHRIRLISDEMIIRGIELGISRDENTTLKRLYTYNPDNLDEFLENYLNWWDERLFDYLVFDTQTGFAHEFFRNLYDRNLFKKVFEIKLNDYKEIQGNERVLLQKITKKQNRKERKKLEAEISRILGDGIEPEYVILNSFQVKSVKEVSRDGEQEGEIIIKCGDGHKRFENESTVFRSIDDSLKENWVEVYAPYNFKDKRDKDTKVKNWKGEIIEILKQGV